MDNNRGNGLRDLFDKLAQVFAFLTLAVFAIAIINANWPFIYNTTLLNILSVAKAYAPLIIAGLVALEFASTKNILIRVVVYVIIAAIVVFQFFPGTWSQFVGIVSKK